MTFKIETPLDHLAVDIANHVQTHGFSGLTIQWIKDKVSGFIDRSSPDVPQDTKEEPEPVAEETSEAVGEPVSGQQYPAPRRTPGKRKSQ